MRVCDVNRGLGTQCYLNLISNQPSFYAKENILEYRSCPCALVLGPNLLWKVKSQVKLK